MSDYEGTPKTLREAVVRGLGADGGHDDVERSVRDFLAQKFTIAEMKHAYASEALGELWSLITGEERK